MPRRPGDTNERDRAAWAARLPVNCVRCGHPIYPQHDWHLDHYPIRYEDGGTTTHPAHATCNHNANGMHLSGKAKAARTARTATPVFPPEVGDQEEPSASVTPQSLPVWCGTPPPDNATWPRLMTAQHPAAVGSYGSDCVEWARTAMGVDAYWWQRLVLARMLEHDSAGVLVWPNVVLSMPRQVGKSWLLRMLAMWRIHQAGRFGEEQTVLHISRGLSASREVQRASREWAKIRRDDGYRVREQNGAQEVSTPDGSRWLIRDQGGAYSFSVSLAVIDEAWGVAPGHIDEGLAPTLLQRVQPQMVLVSTAHRRCTGLMPQRRKVGVDQLGAPRSTLLVEWSAPRDADPSVETARLASPFWSDRRAEFATEAFERCGQVAPSGEETPDDAFNSQWLNRWPLRAFTSEPGEPFLSEADWAAAADLTAVPVAGFVVALEDRTGLGAAGAAAATMADGRVIVWGQSWPSRGQAASWAALLLERRGGRLLVPPALAADDTLAGVPGEVSTVKSTDVSAALPKLRELLGSGRLVHDGGAELTGQVVGMRVAERTFGLAVTRGQCDVARCAALAAAAASRQPAPKPRWAMV